MRSTMRIIGRMHENNREHFENGLIIGHALIRGGGGGGGWGGGGGGGGGGAGLSKVMELLPIGMEYEIFLLSSSPPTKCWIRRTPENESAQRFYIPCELHGGKGKGILQVRTGAVTVLQQNPSNASTPGPLTFVFPWRAWFAMTT